MGRSGNSVTVPNYSSTINYFRSVFSFFDNELDPNVRIVNCCLWNLTGGRGVKVYIYIEIETPLF